MTEHESKRSRGKARRMTGAVTGRLLGAVMVVWGVLTAAASYKDIKRYRKLRSM